MNGPNPADGVDPPADRRPAEHRHYAAMRYQDIPAHFSTFSAVTQFVILTASRQTMVTGMTWDELARPERLWTVPAARMKTKISLRVALSQPALAILAAQPHGNTLVFPSKRGGIIHGSVFSDELAKFSVTLHGFRSSFADWCAETRPDDADACEVALAHAIGSKVTQAYRRTDLLDRRRVLMEAWGAFCTGGIPERA
jgi:integrase